MSPATIPENAAFAVFDTETTGLFQFRDRRTNQPVPADAPGQPRLASFALIYADQLGRAISSEKIFVRPEGWSMAEFDEIALRAGKKPASEVNGLTDEFLIQNGRPVAEVLDLWNAAVDRGLAVTAFNAQFDCKMMRAELRRANRPDRFEETRNICVMRALDPYAQRGLCMTRPGFVKLATACEFFGIVNANAHDAMADAEAARAILEILIRDRLLPDARVHYAA